MIGTLSRLFRNSDATAAVEAAIFAPIFLLFTLAITDLGSGMFVRMNINAAAQAGAAYAIVNSVPNPGGSCVSLTPTCLNGIKTTINEAVGDASFCMTHTCSASITGCTDGSPICIKVTVNYIYLPLLPSPIYAWGSSLSMSSSSTVRIL